MDHLSISTAVRIIIWMVFVYRVSQRVKNLRYRKSQQQQAARSRPQQQQARRPQPAGRDTPPALTRLDGDEAILRAEAADPLTAHARLTVLTTDARFAAAVAANPSCPGAVLDRLSDSWNTEVTFAILSNPNVLPHTLLKLGHLSPSAFFANPVSTLMLLDKPDLPLHCSPDLLLPLVRVAGASPGFLSILSNHPEARVADEACLHVNLSSEVAPEALEDELQRALLRWQMPPMYGLAQVVQAADMGLIPSWLIAPFILHGSDPLRRAIARQSGRRCPTIVLLRRAGAHADLIGYAPPDPTLPADLLALLAGSAPWGRRLAARHPATSPAALIRLAGDRIPEVRRLAARNPGLPATGLASLAGDPHVVIRKEAAYNERTPRHALERLAHDGAWPVRAAIAANRSSAAEIIAMLAADVEWQVRRAAARRAEIGADTLRALAHDPHPLVRVEVAKRRDAPPECVAAFAVDSNPAVRAAAAHSIAACAGSSRQQMRREAAEMIAPPTYRDGAVRPEPPRRLGRRQRPRRAVVEQSVPAPRATVTDVLDKLMAPGWVNAAMCAIALVHPQTPATRRETLGRTGSWVERCAVARNPAASDTILAFLSEDTNRIVRAVAREAQAARVKGACA